MSHSLLLSQQQEKLSCPKDLEPKGSPFGSMTQNGIPKLEHQKVSSGRFAFFTTENTRAGHPDSSTLRRFESSSSRSVSMVSKVVATSRPTCPRPDEGRGPVESFPKRPNAFRSPGVPRISQHGTTHLLAELKRALWWGDWSGEMERTWSSLPLKGPFLSSSGVSDKCAFFGHP